VPGLFRWTLRRWDATEPWGQTDLEFLVEIILNRSDPKKPSRIPLAADFSVLSKAGKRLANLHLDYEKAEPWELEWVHAKGKPLSYRVERMKLDKDKTTLRINESLSLANIPPEVFDYRLGNRSALEWVIDQYQVSEDKQSGISSDPNRPDDEEYIVRLVGQVVRVSVETVKIVSALSATVSLPSAMATEKRQD